VTYRPSEEQNVVRLMPDSTLVIDKLTTVSSGADTVSDTELDLKKGGIYASVKKLSPAAQYLVKTPTGIAGVRGTQFSISLNDDGTIKNVTVFRTVGDDGLVLAVTSAGGATQTYMIGSGEVWEPGNPNPVPITPQLKGLLQAIFSALRTPYYGIVSYDYDRTQCRESTDSGF
jgi:ferric-dicitrate binding protein FerR (iron transport regulator)